MSIIYKRLKSYLFYYLIYLFFFIELIINLQSKYMSRDESFSYNMIHHGFVNIIHLTAQDVHPFLYYFIGKILTYGMNNLYLQIRMLRIVSALPYLILLIIGNTYIKHKFSKSISIIFMFCIIFMPLFSENVYILRMYGWATLFTIIVYLLFRYSYNNDNNIKIFLLISLFSILASYTHYYALITIFILYVSFLILFIIKRKSLRNIILSILIDILLYIPWLRILLNQTAASSKSFWTGKMTLKHLIVVTLGTMSPISSKAVFYIFPLILLLLILYIIIFDKMIQVNVITIIGMATPFLLIIIGTIISIGLNHSILLPRYIMPALGIFWLELSIFIMNISNDQKTLKLILMSLILIIGILSYANTNMSTINTTSKFNKTLKIYNKISNNSAFIYNDLSTMFSRTEYLNNNYTLDYNSSSVYKGTLNNFKDKSNIKLPSKYKNVYYIKSNDNFNELIDKFNKKYKTSNKNKINVPITDGHSNFYKIK